MGKLFISYRRKDADFAHRLAEALQKRIEGYVFIDRNIPKDDFVVALEEEITTCHVFALIVTENTFDSARIHLKDDWIRKEVALALVLKKPIALALREGATPPPPDALPDNIIGIITKHGLPFYPALFEQCVDEFARHCVTISNGALRLISPPSSAPPFNDSRIDASAIHFGTGDIVQRDKITQVIDNTTQNALTKISLHKADEQRLLSTIQALQYDKKKASQPGAGSTALILYFAAAIGLISIGFSISTGIGISAIIVIMCWIVWQSNQRTRKLAGIQTRIDEHQQNLARIQAEIALNQQIANRS